MKKKKKNIHCLKKSTADDNISRDIRTFRLCGVKKVIEITVKSNPISYDFHKRYHNTT